DSMLTVTNDAPQGDGGANIGGNYSVGVYTVHFTAIDACGNESVDSIIVRVIDNSIPTLICNDNVVIALGTNGTATITPDDIDLGSSDNCGIDTMYLSQATFDCGDLGINAVTLTAVDNAGNSNTCSVDVNVTPGANTGFTLTTTSTPESVSGANDGTATATATGGSGLFSYDWSNNDTTAAITGLASGTYIVIVTDKQSGCQQTDTVIVEEGIKINITVGSGEGCINQTISIPVTVDNFTDVTDFNFTLHITGDTVGTIIGITAGSIDPGLVAGFSSNLLPGNNLGVFWSDTALTLPNGAVLFSIDIKLGTAAVGSVSPVIITGTPVSLLFLQLINGDEVAVDVDTLNGLIEITCGLPDLEIGGDIQTWNNPVPVPGVDVSLTGTVTANQTTGAPGTYLFGIPDSANTIVRCKKITAGNAGITGADILLIKRHVLNIQPLVSPYQFVAADVSGEGNLSILDYARIQQVALALLDHITGSPDWKFVPKSYVFPVPPLSAPFPDSISHLPATMSFLDDDFVAVRMGDVNGNVVPSFTSDNTDDRSGTFRFRLDERSFEAGETIEVPFLASGFNGHSGYQMTIDFDREVFELAGIEPGILPDMNDANFGAMRTQEGMLTTLWVTPEPMTVADGSVLFTLKFKVLRSGNTLSEVLRPGSELTRAEGYDSEGNTMKIDFEFVQKQNGATTAAFVLYQNQPNPFSDMTTVAFRLPEAGPATLRIFNASGQLVNMVTANFDQGYHELRFRRDELGTPGVYYYELESGGNMDRKKMVLMN
ncbi:MAG TPA: cohesin domain-containing protein, partial [Saprospiraceae bacterium]|nr:cohesin domain-containing protein [Saprospiraceae bacterium]